MHRFLYPLFLFSSVLGIFKLQAQEALFEVKAAYFEAIDDRFQDIYSEGAIYGVEATVQLYRCLYGFVSASVFAKSGESLNENSNTEIYLFPIGVGAKFFFPFNCRCDSFYVGAGVLPTYLHIDDKSDFVTCPVEKWGVGGILKAGFIFYFWKCFFIDVFGDYSFLKIDFNNKKNPIIFRDDAKLDHYTVGGGLGYRF